MKTITARDIQSKTYQVPVDQLTFRPAVYAVIIKDGKVLLAKTWDGYTLPGGGMLIDETIKEAVVREVKEETGFDIVVNNLLHCDESYFQKYI